MKNLSLKIGSVLLFTLAFVPSFSQWDLNGNSLNGSEKIGSTNATSLDFITNGIPRMTITPQGQLGLGTNMPNGHQEITYCPPLNQSESGLIVTLNKCNGNVVNISENVPDVIGGGIVDWFDEEGGQGETEGGVQFPSFAVPFNFLTGNNTNLTQPLYAKESPMFWLRHQKPTGFNPGNSSADEYDTKFIVMPDGSCGINVVNPRAALDVRGSQATNRPAAIIGSRALGTGTTGATGLYQYHTQQVQFVPSLSEDGFNQIVKKGDQGMFFSDGKGTEGANASGSFILAPWAEGGNPDIGGMRMDAQGNTEFHGTIRTTEVIVNAQWWSDFVFEDDYPLRSLSEVEHYINKNKHLPDVPSEKEVLENGLRVSDMQAIQQQKIEELTLYLINQEKKITFQQKRLEELEALVSELLKQ